MPYQQKICKFCTSIRVFSSFEVAYNFPVLRKTFSTNFDWNKTCVSSNPIFWRYKSCFQNSKRKYYTYTSSVFTDPTCAFSEPPQGTAPTVIDTALTQRDSTRRLYKNIIESFPDGIEMAFAYGSGAIQQGKSNDINQNMLDFIFVVDKPKQWHEMNLEKHPNHYSFLKYLGPRGLAKFQDSYGAGVYFNTLVPMHSRVIKYGVISTARLITDLLDWDSLYVSGRLHKPINLIVVPKDENLLEALIENLESAVHTALLLLPDLFTEERLYTTIASLSYSGDIRMSMAEDSNKVRNIVKPNIKLFRRMYLPIVMKQESVVFWEEEGQLEQALTFESRHHHMTNLPYHVIQGLVKQKYQVGVFPDMEEIIRLIAYDTDCGSKVAKSVENIVQTSSITQTTKGVLTAGLYKSIRYGLSKVMKKIKSR